MKAPKAVHFMDVYPNYDAMSQLRSIIDLLNKVFAWRNSVHGEIKQSERVWMESEPGDEELGAQSATFSLYHKSMYVDAAAVQSAVGVLAPFVEGFLVHAFGFLRHLHGNNGAPSEHKRWMRAGDTFWNPRKPSGLIDGVNELRDALGLGEWLTIEHIDNIELLFSFRNRSLHYAYEWPPEEVSKFLEHIEQQKWGSDLESARSGGVPWILYLSDSYLSRVMQTTKGLVDGYRSVASAKGGVFRSDTNALPKLDLISSEDDQA